MRKAKIIATLGPATETPDKIRELMEAGMDVVRLNFSHGTQDEHARRIQMVRAVAGEHACNIAILGDLPGPKIRTGRLQERRAVALKAGDAIRLTPKDILGNAKRVHVSYPHLARDVRKGDRILLSDGLIELRVRSRSDDEVVAEIINGGLLGEHKGVNLPGVRLRLAALTPEDECLLHFGLEHEVDYIALSFVRAADNIRAVKEIIARAGKNTPVIAKLEKPEALDNLDAILQVTDAVMVARGDLGVELPPEQVPVVQKAIIERAAAAKIPVITATQMLESMTSNPRPTRAEASDVANAIFDGSDAVMLSGETASGQYPCESVRMMARIVEVAEEHMLKSGWWRRPVRENTVAETICDSVSHASTELDIKAVIVFTRSGFSARLMSKYRPVCPIYAFCHDPAVCRRMALLWGVRAREVPFMGEIDAQIRNTDGVLLDQKCVMPGDMVAYVAGSRFGEAGGTNMMMLLPAGEASASGGE